MVTPGRVLSILAIWGAATAFGLAIATWTAVGPVVLVLTRRHGVHLGDLIALTAAYGQSALLTRRLLQRPGRRRAVAATSRRSQ